MTAIGWIKKMVAGAAIAGALYGGSVQAEKPEIKPGYNALENAVTAEGDVRTRTVNNIDLELGPVVLGWHGLNEINNADPDTYFGRNRVMVGKKGFGTRLIADNRIDHNGVFDTKVGIRNTDIPKKLGGYGFVDLMVDVDGDSGNVTAFYGVPLPKGFSAETIQSVDIPFDGNPSVYSEVQVNKNIGKHLGLFGRVEAVDFKDPTYLLGVMLTK